MKLWIDAQLSPALAPWITEHFEGIEAIAVRELGLRILLADTLSMVVDLLQQGERLVEISGP